MSDRTERWGAATSCIDTRSLIILIIRIAIARAQGAAQLQLDTSGEVGEEGRSVTQATSAMSSDRAGSHRTFRAHPAGQKLRTAWMGSCKAAAQRHVRRERGELGCTSSAPRDAKIRKRASVSGSEAESLLTRE